MTIKRASLYLLALYVAVYLLGEVLFIIRPALEPITPMGSLMINKVLLTVGLLVLVYALNIHRQCGLVFKANWRTLPLYWPLALIAAMALSTGVNLDTSLTMLVMIFITVVAVGINEELMFRGMVFYWFNAVSVRKQILISACSFGGLHLLGLFSQIPPGIILAQVYLATGLGVIFAYARSRDYSIMIPILVHAMFNFVTLAAKGGVVEAATSGKPEEIITGLIVAGTIGWLWGGYLLWKHASHIALPVQRPYGA